MKNHADAEISIFRSVASMVVILAALMFMNFFPDRVGFYLSATDPHGFMLVRTSLLTAHLPWLNLWWGLLIALRLVHLITKRWTSLTRSADLLLSGLGVFVLGKILMGGPLFVSPIVSFVAKLLLGVAIFALLLRTAERFERAWGAKEPTLRPDPAAE